jgi:hypothetical protein
LPAGPTLAAEVRRNIATYTAQSPRHVVSGLYLAGNGENAGLEACLQEALGIPVRSFDPFVGAEETGLPRQNRGAFAGAVGLLRAQGDGRPLPINFLSPKQPKVARDPNKKRLAIGAAIAAVLLIGVVTYCNAQLAGLSRDLENLDLRKLSFQKKEKEIEEVESNFKALNEWRRGNISWLDELYDLTALFPDGHTMPLLEFDGKAQPPTSARDTAKNKPAAQMTLTIGPSANFQTLGTLLRQMEKDKGHYLSLGKDTTADGRTKAQIDLEKQPPGKFNRVVQGSSGDRPKPSPIRPAVSNGASSSVSRNRVAIPKKGDMVNIVAGPPAQPAAGRSIGPAKNEPVPAAPVAGVQLDPVQGFGAMFEAVKEAHAYDPEKARALIEERQKVQMKALGEQIAPTPAAPALKAAPPVASPKGNTP